MFSWIATCNLQKGSAAYNYYINGLHMQTGYSIINELSLLAILAVL